MDEAGFFAHLHAAGLLGQTDVVVLPLDVRDVAQGQGYRVADAVADTDAVQGGGKFRGVGGAHEQQHNGDGAGVFQHHIQVVEQLLRRQRIPSRQGQQHRAAAVQLGTVAGTEQVDQHIVQDHVYDHGSQGKGDVLHPELCRPKQDQSGDSQGRQQRRVEAGHGGHAPQQQTHQLAGAGEPVDGRGAVNVVKQVGHLRTS